MAAVDEPTHSRRGHPGKTLAVTEAELALALRRAGGVYSHACALLTQAGKPYNRDALCKRVRRSKRLQREISNATETITDIAESHFISDIRKGDKKAYWRWLITKGKYRGYTFQFQHEMSGPNGEPLPASQTNIYAAASAVTIVLPDNGRDPDYVKVVERPLHGDVPDSGVAVIPPPALPNGGPAITGNGASDAMLDPDFYKPDDLGF